MEINLNFTFFFQGIIYLKLKKDESYVTVLDEYKSIRTNWIAKHVNGNNVIYFDKFANEHTPREIEEFIENKNVTTNIYRI